MADPPPPSQNGRELPLSAGEKRLVRQLRDIMGKMGTKPYQVSVLVIDGTWYIYESVQRGKVQP